MVAAREMLSGHFASGGLVPPDRHVDAERLFAYLKELKITVAHFEPPS